MTSLTGDYLTYILADSALAGGAAKYLRFTDEFPAWAIPLYNGKAALQSPLVLDVQRAWDDGAIDQLMALVNALQPALHVSVIDTLLSPDELAQHLRRFIFITTEENKQLTLRFADCAVLPELAAVLTPAQYAALARPVLRWRVHQRDGQLGALAPTEKEIIPASTPLALTDQQIASVYERMAPYQVLAQLKQNWPGRELPGSAAEQYQWASDTRKAWQDAGNSNEEAMVVLAEAVLASSGQLLEHRLWRKFVGTTDTVQLQTFLQQALVHEPAD